MSVISCKVNRVNRPQAIVQPPPHARPFPPRASLRSEPVDNVQHSRGFICAAAANICQQAHRSSRTEPAAPFHQGGHRDLGRLLSLSVCLSSVLCDFSPTARAAGGRAEPRLDQTLINPVAKFLLLQQRRQKGVASKSSPVLSI